MILDIHASIKTIKEEDLEQLRLIDNEKLVEFFNDPFTFNIGIVYEHGKILGFGLIRVVNEFKMSLDPNISEFSKAKTIKKLLDSACELSQCNEIIVEITKGGMHYIDSLVKHYNFYETKSTVLRMEK